MTFLFTIRQLSDDSCVRILRVRILLDRLETMRDVAIRKLSDLSSALEIELTLRNEQIDARDALLRQMAEALRGAKNVLDGVTPDRNTQTAEECQETFFAIHGKVTYAIAAYDGMVRR